MSSEMILRPDPAALERDVIRLREDCRRVVDELERRYQAVVALPGRVKAAVRSAPTTILRALRAHPVIAAAGILGMVAVAYLCRPRR